MSKANRKQLGNYGEQLAGNEYVHSGYTLIAQQYRCPYGEIDIIARKEQTLVFVEVRTKTSQTFGSAEESITTKKKHTIYKVSQFFLNEMNWHHYHIQYDMVSIYIDKKNKKAWLKRYPGAF